MQLKVECLSFALSKIQPFTLPYYYSPVDRLVRATIQALSFIMLTIRSS